MKRIFFLLAVASCLSSCIARFEGPKGDKGDPGSLNIKVIDLKVETWDYSKKDANNYFFADFDVPELTKMVYDYGATQCYIEYDSDASGRTQQILPSVRHQEQSYGGNLYYFTETIDYDFGVGTVRIYLTQSDFNYETDQTWVPNPMNFRLVLMW